MNIKQYILHLKYWLLSFPLWSESEHVTVGIANSGEYKCMLCDYVEIEKPTKRKVRSKSKKNRDI